MIDVMQVVLFFALVNAVILTFIKVVFVGVDLNDFEERSFIHSYREFILELRDKARIQEGFSVYHFYKTLGGCLFCFVTAMSIFQIITISAVNAFGCETIIEYLISSFLYVAASAVFSKFTKP